MTETTYQCIGCGALIQTEHSDQAGYLPQSALAKGIESGDFYCQRCFRLRHYNELADVELSDELFIERLASIASEDAYVFYMMDIFDLEGSLISGFKRLIGDNPFSVLVNKYDLLPKSTKANRVKDWIRRFLADNRLKPEAIHLISARKTASLEEVFDQIASLVVHQDVYIVGVTNVGKSSFINQLINHFGGDKEIITTSNHPGTTLDMIRIPMTEETAIVDTPGIIKPSQLEHYLSREDIKQVLPSKPFKPKTFQLNPEQTLFVAGLARLDFFEGPRTSFTLYVNQGLYIHRTKLAAADEFYDKHLGGLLQPPSQSSLDQFPVLSPRRVVLEAGQDLAISGLGWLTVNERVELRVWLAQGVASSIRPAII